MKISDAQFENLLTSYLVEGKHENKGAVHAAMKEIVAVCDRSAHSPKIKCGSYAEIRKELADMDVSLLWNGSQFDKKRHLFRPSFNELFGPGAANVMPGSAAYLTTPGVNKAYFPEGIDPTLLSYLQHENLLGDYTLIKDIDDLCATARAENRKVYAIDDCGVQNDDVMVNNTSIMKLANSKEFVSYLTAFAPEETLMDIGEAKSSDYWKHSKRLNDPVFIKTCNTESSGRGVYIARTPQQFENIIKQIGELAHKYQGSQSVIVQSAVSGANRSLQLFLGKQNTYLVSVSDQLIAEDGKSYAGNINRELTDEVMDEVMPVATSITSRLKAINPDTFGFVMCDFITSSDNKLVAIDPGLRPSGSTAASLLSLLFKSRGLSVYIGNAVPIDMGGPMPYAQVAEKLGDFAKVDRVIANKMGALPWGFNHLNGTGKLIVIAPSEAQYHAALDAIFSRLMSSEETKAA